MRLPSYSLDGLWGRVSRAQSSGRDTHDIGGVGAARGGDGAVDGAILALADFAGEIVLIDLGAVLDDDVVGGDDGVRGGRMSGATGR